MVGVGCIVASAFAGWTYVGLSSVRFIVRATVDSVGSCLARLITTGSGAGPPSEVYGFESPTVDPSSKLKDWVSSTSVAGVACPRAHVGLTLISYCTCLNLGGGVVVVVSDSTLL
ncbi:hypothetical protein ACOSQ3_013480 [Xanthoceras sorbifolium]